MLKTFAIPGAGLSNGNINPAHAYKKEGFKIK